MTRTKTWHARLRTSVALLAAALIVQAFLLVGCEGGPGNKSEGDPDRKPSFGGQTIANQTYTAGTLITPRVLPAATGGNSPLTYSLAPNVPGLRFTAANRTLSGTPTTADIHIMTYRVVDSDGDDATLTFTLLVAEPEPELGSVVFWTNATEGWTQIDVWLNGASIGSLTEYRDSTPSECTVSGNDRVVATRAPGNYSYRAQTQDGEVYWEGQVMLTAGGCVRYLLHCGDDRMCGPDVPETASDGGRLGTRDTVPEVPYEGGTINDAIGVVTLATGGKVGDPVRIEVGVRDHACEDGDRVSVQVQRTASWEEIFNGEIFNPWQVRYFDATVGYHYTIVAIALNGTGFKGNCSHVDLNSGELRVRYGGHSETTSWFAPGGDGSAGVINIVP